jgi:hypothetical protein
MEMEPGTNVVRQAETIVTKGSRFTAVHIDELGIQGLSVLDKESDVFKLWFLSTAEEYRDRLYNIHLYAGILSFSRADFTAVNKFTDREDQGKTANGHGKAAIENSFRIVIQLPGTTIHIPSLAPHLVFTCAKKIDSIGVLQGIEFNPCEKAAYTYLRHFSQDKKPELMDIFAERFGEGKFEQIQASLKRRNKKRNAHSLSQSRMKGRFVKKMT